MDGDRDEESDCKCNRQLLSAAPRGSGKNPRWGCCRSRVTKASCYRFGWMYEYMHITGPDMDGLAQRLNALGSVGWRAVGFGVGVAYNAVVERELTPWPLPTAPGAAWGADPAGRFTQRYWDGLRWTEHVTDTAGAQSSAWPYRG